MKLYITLLLALGAILFPSFVSAHPLDISYTDIHIRHDQNNEKIPDNVALGAVYLPWLEASILVQRSEKISSPEAKILKNYHKPYTEYLNKHLSFSNDGKRCEAIYGLPPDQPENEILFGRGLMIPVRYQCPSKLNKFTVINSIFVDEFPVQQNVVNIYNGPEISVKGALLTSKSTDFTFDANELTQHSTTEKTENFNSPLLDRLSQGFLDAQEQSFTLAVVLVFLLGLLHTLEVGHSKTVLTSFLIQKRATIKHGLLFALIFTVTHVADIVILGLMLVVTNSFIDVFARLSYLQTFSLYTLLFISVYMLVRSVAQILQNKLLPKLTNTKPVESDHGHEHAIDVKNIKKQLMIGFITGLSPCLFGWSVFMVILTTKKIWVVFPIILSFGLGIFTALALVVFIVVKFKLRLMNKYQWLADISPVISSLILLAFAFSALI